MILTAHGWPLKSMNKLNFLKISVHNETRNYSVVLIIKKRGLSGLYTVRNVFLTNPSYFNLSGHCRVDCATLLHWGAKALQLTVYYGVVMSLGTVSMIPYSFIKGAVTINTEIFTSEEVISYDVYDYCYLKWLW